MQLADGSFLALQLLSLNQAELPPARKLPLCKLPAQTLILIAMPSEPGQIKRMKLEAKEANHWLRFRV